MGISISSGLKTIISPKHSWLRRLIYIYFPLFTIYCLFLLWQKIFAWDVVLYSLGTMLILEFCFRLLRI